MPNSLAGLVGADTQQIGAASIEPGGVRLLSRANVIPVGGDRPMPGFRILNNEQGWAFARTEHAPWSPRYG